MKVKKAKAVFICQITADSLRVIKCLVSSNSKREFADLEIQPIPPDIDDKRLAERLNQVLKNLAYSQHPIIVSLPRYQVTSRFLKVPTQAPEEIERIISLQASRYLPYPANELITGYQAISVDKEGYSQINMIIVHKDIIARYLKVFKALNIKDFQITLGSYGLSNLYNYLEPKEIIPTMIIDIDPSQAELAVVSGEKLLFSRSFKVARQQDWQHLLIEEINKTKDAYLREIQDLEPKKMVITGGKDSQEIKEVMGNQIALPINALSYWEKISVSKKFLDATLSLDYSLANLIGLGLKDIPQSLNLLPQDIKENIKKIFKRKGRLRLILLIAGIILIWGLGIAKNLDNKTKYLNQLNLELEKIEKDAQPLEEIEKRARFMESHLQKKSSSLDILYEVHKTIPQQISLSNFSYEEDNLVVLRGQTADLNSVFTFVRQLEKSSAFKDFNIKVRYATQKKIQSGEVVDFEINCFRK